MPLYLPEHPTSQTLGSAITYARRYALTAVLNLVADEDDDGQAATSAPATFLRQAHDRRGEGARPQQKKLIVRKPRRQDNASEEAAQCRRIRLAVSWAWLDASPSRQVDEGCRRRSLIDRLLQGRYPYGRV